MREILFKAKLCHTSEWIYGNLAITTNGKAFVIPIDVCYQDGHHLQINSDAPFFVDPETVCQFTGLLDKNGEKIFEGDVLTKDGWCASFEVKYSQKLAVFLTFNAYLDCRLRFDENSHEYIIIGNAHDKEAKQ